MNHSQKWSNRVVCVASLFAGCGAAHLIDDFLYGVPAEFHMTNESAQVLGMLFFVALIGLIALAGRGSRQSYVGLIVIGLLLAASDLTKHVPEMVSITPYRSTLSQGLIIGLIVSGLATAAVSYAALRATK